MFEDKTPEAIKQEILSAIRSGQGLSAMAGGFADGVAGPVSVEMSKLYMALDAVPSMILLDESSGPFIALVGEQYWNITRRPGAKAYCTMTFTGSPGYVIPAGTRFLTGGGLSFSLAGEVTLGAQGTGQGQLEADEVGSAYNVAAGAIDRMYVNLAGLTAYTNMAAQGGADPETDADLLERIRERVQQPPTSGNGYYYRQLAMSVSGVGNAKVTELAAGAGTVGVVLVGPDGRTVSEGTVEDVEAAIAPQRVIGAQVSVSAATEVTVNVSASVTLSGEADAAAVEDALEEQTGAYLASLIDQKYGAVYYAPGEDTAYYVLYNRILGILLGVPGVENYSALTLNGGSANVSIGKDQIPVLGTVTVTEG